MSEYDWHPVVPLRWSAAGKLQQQFKRRVSNDRGVWYDEFEWRDVPRQPVDEIPLVKYPSQETPDEHGLECRCFRCDTRRLQETPAECSCNLANEPGATRHAPYCALNRESAP